jgi:serine/threonine protein kinase
MWRRRCWADLGEWRQAVGEWRLPLRVKQGKLHTYHDNKSLVSMTRRSPRTLSVGAHNTVVALNEHEVAKLFAGDTRSDIGSEAEKMRFANSVNSLVVRFLRMEFSEEHDAEMLVMERHYPMDFRAYEYGKRELWFEVFEREIRQLHAAGFAHRDIRRPSNIVGEPYDNVLLTSNGLRLIDVGVSALREKVGDKLFLRYVEEERKEIEEFRSHFLLR